MDSFDAWYDNVWKRESARHAETCSGGEDFSPCTGRRRENHILLAYMLPVMTSIVRESEAYRQQPELG